MPYIFLKNIIESVLEHYICPQCQNKTSEQDIHVAGITTQGVDLHIHCQSCNTNSMLHAEVNTLASQLLQNEHGRKFFEDFIKQGGTIGVDVKNKKDTNQIKDEDIVKIHNDLKNAKSIEDIMGKDN